MSMAIPVEPAMAARFVWVTLHVLATVSRISTGSWYTRAKGIPAGMQPAVVEFTPLPSGEEPSRRWRQAATTDPSGNRNTPDW